MSGLSLPDGASPRSTGAVKHTAPRSSRDSGRDRSSPPFCLGLERSALARPIRSPSQVVHHEPRDVRRERRDLRAGLLERLHLRGRGPHSAAHDRASMSHPLPFGSGAPGDPDVRRLRRPALRASHVLSPGAEGGCPWAPELGAAQRSSVTNRAISVGNVATFAPARLNASIFEAAVPIPRLTMAPACPILFPSGAARPAMYA
jgi:hypothetical protein